MSKIVFDRETFDLINLFGRICRVDVKDCFRDSDFVYFVVGRGEVGKAIGKGAVNIKKLGQILNTRVKVIEYRDTPTAFVKSFIYPVQVEEVVLEDEVVLIKDQNRKTKSLLIGRDGKNIKLLNKAVKRFFDVEEVKVV